MLNHPKAAPLVSKMVRAGQRFSGRSRWVRDAAAKHCGGEETWAPENSCMERGQHMFGTSIAVFLDSRERLVRRWIFSRYSAFQPFLSPFSCLLPSPHAMALSGSQTEQDFPSKDKKDWGTSPFHPPQGQIFSSYCAAEGIISHLKARLLLLGGN